MYGECRINLRGRNVERTLEGDDYMSSGRLVVFSCKSTGNSSLLQSKFDGATEAVSSEDYEDSLYSLRKVG